MKKLLLVFLLAIFFHDASALGEKKQVRLRLTDTLSAKLDEADIYLDMGISPAYISVEDAIKILDTAWAVPQVYSLTSNGVECFSNGYGNFTQTTVIKLGYRVQGGGVYAFTTTLLDNFDPTTLLLLEDRVAGKFHNLREGAYYVAVNTPEHTNDRFYLHISFPPTIAIIPSDCENNDGGINVIQDTSIVWSFCQLYDSNMNYISAYSNIKGNFNFDELVEGHYNLAFVFGIYSAVLPIYISGNQIIASIHVPSVYANVGQTVQFFSHAPNATQYEWDFGDSTLVNGVANPEMAYNKPGTYPVTLRCSNSAGCVAYAYTTIYVQNTTGIDDAAEEQVRIAISNGQLRLISNPSGNPLYRVHLYNLSGQLMEEHTIHGGNNLVNIGKYAAGIYLVRINTADKTITQKIFLE